MLSLALAAAGCVPELGGWQVVGGGALGCDFTRPTLAVLVNRYPSPSRVEVVELGEPPRPCGPLDGRGGLNEYHQATTWVPGRPYLAFTSAVTWQVLDYTTDRFELELASNVMATSLDGFALLDGDHFVAVFPADGGRTSTIDAEDLLFFDVDVPDRSRAETPSTLGLGGSGTVIDCTVDPQNPSAMLCIRGGLSSMPAAAVEARPFEPGYSPTVRAAGPDGVVFDRISSYPGGRIAWRGHRTGEEALGVWLAEGSGAGWIGPFACPQCAEVGDVVPDPSRADGFYLSCADASGQGILVRADATACAIVLSTGPGTPYDLALRMP